MNRLVCLVLVALPLAIPAASARGGAVLTRAGQASLGPLVEGESSVSLQVANGAVEYRKEMLLWYTTDADVDSLLKAARKARDENRAPAALALYALSLAQELATSEEARAEALALRASITNQAAVTAATNAPAAPSLVTPEDKVAQGTRMVEGGKDVLAAGKIDPDLAAAAHDTARKNIAEGERLVAEGQKEIAEKQAKAAAETASREEPRTAASPPIASSWTKEDLLANGAVALFVAILIFSSLHRIAMREPKA